MIRQHTVCQRSLLFQGNTGRSDTEFFTTEGVFCGSGQEPYRAAPPRPASVAKCFRGKELTGNNITYPRFSHTLGRKIIRMNHRQDSPCYDIPVITYGKRDDRLNVQYLFRPLVIRSKVFIVIELKRYADHAGNRVGQFLYKFLLVGFFADRFPDQIQTQKRPPFNSVNIQSRRYGSSGSGLNSARSNAPSPNICLNTEKIL